MLLTVSVSCTASKM